MSLLGDKELQNVCTASSSSCLLELVDYRRSWRREFGVIQPSDFAEYSFVCTIWTICWSLWLKILTSKQAWDVILDSSLPVCHTQRSLGYDIQCHFLNHTLLVCLLLYLLSFDSSRQMALTSAWRLRQYRARLSAWPSLTPVLDCPPTSHSVPLLLLHPLLLHCTMTPRQWQRLCRLPVTSNGWWVPSMGPLHGSLASKHRIHHHPLSPFSASFIFSPTWSAQATTSWEHSFSTPAFSSPLALVKSFSLIWSSSPGPDPLDTVNVFSLCSFAKLRQFSFRIKWPWVSKWRQRPHEN